MTQIQSQIFEKDNQMAFIDDKFFDDFDDADGQLGEKLQQKWSKKMDEIVDVIKSDIHRETAPYKKDLGWTDTPTFLNGTAESAYQISFEELIESDGFFSLPHLSNKKTRKSAPGLEKQESTYQKIATMPTRQASGQKHIGEDVFDFDVQGNTGEALEIGSADVE